MLPVAAAMPVPATTPMVCAIASDAADPAAPADRHLVGDRRGHRGEHRVERGLHAAPAERHHRRRWRRPTAPAARPRRRARRRPPRAAAGRRAASSGRRRRRRAGCRPPRPARPSPVTSDEHLLLVRRVERLGLLGEQHLDRAEEAGPQPDAGQGQQATQRAGGSTVGSASAERRAGVSVVTPDAGSSDAFEQEAGISRSVFSGTRRTARTARRRPLPPLGRSSPSATGRGRCAARGRPGGRPRGARRSCSTSRVLGAPPLRRPRRDAVFSTRITGSCGACRLAPFEVITTIGHSACPAGCWPPCRRTLRTARPGPDPLPGWARTRLQESCLQKTTRRPGSADSSGDSVAP